MGMWHPHSSPETSDEREGRRVELVGLAAEVATVAGRVQEDLAGLEATAQVDELRAECERLLGAAMGVLSPGASVDTASEALDDALASFREHQGACVLLRAQADVLGGGVTILL
jgi:hypothetical protein